MNSASQRDFSDPRIPNRNECVVRDLIDRWAEERPEKVYVVFEDGEEWNYRDLKNKVTRCALGFQKLGVKQGDTVAVWLPNSKDCLLTFYALNYIGAIFTPFNTAYRGNLLAHVIENSDADVIVAHGELAPRLSEVDLAKLTKLVVSGPEAPSIEKLVQSRFEELSEHSGELEPLDRPIDPWDPQSIIYTSGTTGPSKGVLSSYLHMFSNAGPESWPMVGEDDRYLIPAPMFHIGGMGAAFVMLARGASIALLNNFSTNTFWETAKRFEATVVFLLGVMATFLLKQPERDDDRDNPVRTAFVVPLGSDSTALADRFGLNVYTIFNMTEISSPIVSQPNPTKRGTCGKIRPGVEVRLVDENDCEVEVGSIGEMIVRTDRPWAMNSGYFRNPEATARAWRNGWFHTGDAFRKDEDGNFFFVDRVKDAIRRRGENISSFEVESEVCAFGAVREAAAIGVESEYSEDEVMVIISAVEGELIDPVELSHFLADRMPYFMVPRYVRVVDDLPKTPSNKVKKADLRKEGVTADTWDREAAKMRLRREVLS